MQSDFLTPEFVADGQEAVDGVYRLGALRGRSAGGVVYETTYGEDARPAAIKVSRGNQPESAGTLDRWRAAMTFSHRNLLRVYAAGKSVLNNETIIYVVTERADESLAGVLAQRRLAEEEVREMLGPTLTALEYLHENGYAHGRVKPTNILAVGETVKLSSDSISQAEGDDARAEDVYATGRLIQESMPSEPGVAPVLAEVVHHATAADPSRRWTVQQMQFRLHGPVAEPGEEEVEPGKRSIPNRITPKQSSPNQISPKQIFPKRTFPKWIVAGLAALVLIVIGLAVMRKKAPAPAVVSAPREQPAASAPKSRPIAPAPAPAPSVRKPAPASAVAATGTAQQGRRSSGWAVIVAAYGNRAPAEKRQRSLEEKWPAFRWSVLNQHADKTYYLVVIGQNLSEDDAEALRKRAVQSGLPRDAYIKRVP
jgi:serine/threonine protein kinase